MVQTKAWLVDLDATHTSTIGNQHMVEYIAFANLEIMPVPLAPKYSPGVILWRNQVIPIIDLARVLNPHERDLDEMSGVMILTYQEAPGSPLQHGAIVLRSVPQTIMVDGDMACPLPESPSAWQKLAVACISNSGKVAPILNVKTLFSSSLRELYKESQKESQFEPAASTEIDDLQDTDTGSVAASVIPDTQLEDSVPEESLIDDSAEVAVSTKIDDLLDTDTSAAPLVSAAEPSPDDTSDTASDPMPMEVNNPLSVNDELTDTDMGSIAVSVTPDTQSDDSGVDDSTEPATSTEVDASILYGTALPNREEQVDDVEPSPVDASDTVSDSLADTEQTPAEVANEPPASSSVSDARPAASLMMPNNWPGHSESDDSVESDASADASMPDIDTPAPLTAAQSIRERLAGVPGSSAGIENANLQDAPVLNTDMTINTPPLPEVDVAPMTGAAPESSAFGVETNKDVKPDFDS